MHLCTVLTRRTILTAPAMYPLAAHARSIPILVRGHRLQFGPVSLRCSIGRNGISQNKREGDGTTPAGVFLLREVFYRPDRVALPSTALPVRPLTMQTGWCDDPDNSHYNQLIVLPHPGHHELMWRDDEFYDVLAVIGFNDDPPIPGRGSAIFLHVAGPRWTSTDGCVALARDALLWLLSTCTPDTIIDIA